jgi:hypothetical protein
MTTPIFAYKGTGKTFYASKYPDTARDMAQGESQAFSEFVAEVIAEIGSGAHKYAFLPCDLALKRELLQKNIAFVVVMPGGKLSDWVRRWLEAGDSARAISERVTFYKQTVQDFRDDPVIYLDGASEEWLGNVLQKYSGTAVTKDE